MFCFFFFFLRTYFPFFPGTDINIYPHPIYKNVFSHSTACIATPYPDRGGGFLHFRDSTSKLVITDPNVDISYNKVFGNCRGGAFRFSNNFIMLPNFLKNFKLNSAEQTDKGPDLYLPSTAPNPIFACPSGHMFDRKADMKATLRSFSYSTHACVPCSIAKFQPNDFSFSCFECTQGRYNDVTGQDSCKLCASGMYQNELGRIECDECPVGRSTRDAMGSALCGT